MNKSYINLNLILLAIIMIALNPVSTTAVTYVAFEDDFTYSNDLEASMSWIVMRETGDPSKEVVWDPDNSLVYLTTARPGANGGLYLKGVDLRYFKSWKIDAIVFIGNHTPRADGLAINIFHNAALGWGGGNLGARSRDARGMLIEIDTYDNGEGLALPHVALANAETSYTVHEFVFAQGITDILDRWIYIEIEFNRTSINSTSISGDLTVRIWSGADRNAKAPIGVLLVENTTRMTISNELGALGFTAATGALYEVHAIDWVRLTASIHVVGGDAYLFGTTSYGIIYLLSTLLIISIAYLAVRKR